MLFMYAPWRALRERLWCALPFFCACGDPGCPLLPLGGFSSEVLIVLALVRHDASGFDP